MDIAKRLFNPVFCSCSMTGFCMSRYTLPALVGLGSKKCGRLSTAAAEQGVVFCRFAISYSTGGSTTQCT